MRAAIRGLTPPRLFALSLIASALMVPGCGKKSGLIVDPPFSSPPTIASTTPADNATGVALNTPLVVTFSRAMNPATVVAGLSPPVSTGTPVMSAGNTVATFTPAATLIANKSYTLVVSGQDVSGGDLSGTTTFHFTTGAAPAGSPF